MIGSGSESHLSARLSGGDLCTLFSSDKLLNLGFQPKKNVKTAIREIISAYNLNELNTDESCFSVKWLKKILEE